MPPARDSVPGSSWPVRAWSITFTWNWCGHWLMTIRNCSVKITPVLWCSLAVLSAATAGPAGLEPLVRALRQQPAPARRAAVETYAVTHPKEAPLARLALGIAAYEQKDYPTAIANLKKAGA